MVCQSLRVTLLASVATIAKATVVHFPPAQTNTNNLTFALSGTGAPGIFNSSTVPDKSYGEYNWCNMPHVRTREYKYASLSFGPVCELTGQNAVPRLYFTVCRGEMNELVPALGELTG
jgi:hypothetical protein